MFILGDVQYQINSLGQLSESCLDGEKIKRTVFSKRQVEKFRKRRQLKTSSMLVFMFILLHES